MGLLGKKFDQMQTEEQRYFARSGSPAPAPQTSGGQGLDPARGEGWTQGHRTRQEARHRGLRKLVVEVGEIHRNRRGDWVVSGWTFDDPNMRESHLNGRRPVNQGLGSFTAADLVEIYERETGRKVRDDS